MDKVSIEEWHSYWMGWGDGAGLVKGIDVCNPPDEIAHPRIIVQRAEHPRPDPMTPPITVVFAEPWYYKLGLGVGRLTWLFAGGLVVALLKWFVF